MPRRRSLVFSALRDHPISPTGSEPGLFPPRFGSVSGPILRVSPAAIHLQPLMSPNRIIEERASPGELLAKFAAAPEWLLFDHRGTEVTEKIRLIYFFSVTSVPLWSMTDCLEQHVEFFGRRIILQEAPGESD